MADEPVIYSGTPRMYDEVLYAAGPGSEAPPGERSWGEAQDAYERLMWEEATTAEELLAAQLAENASGVPGGTRYPGYTMPSEFKTYACIRWPWGPRVNERHGLRIGGRNPLESRLRLRDALVESAREQVA